MSSSELDTLQAAFRAAGGKWSTFVIWAKNAFTMGRADYQRQYEPILYGWKDGAQHYWCGARDQGDRVEDQEAAQERFTSNHETCRVYGARGPEQQQDEGHCARSVRRLRHYGYRV